MGLGTSNGSATYAVSEVGLRNIAILPPEGGLKGFTCLPCTIIESQVRGASTSISSPPQPSRLFLYLPLLDQGHIRCLSFGSTSVRALSRPSSPDTPPRGSHLGPWRSLIMYLTFHNRLLHKVRFPTPTAGVGLIGAPSRCHVNRMLRGVILFLLDIF